MLEALFDMVYKELYKKTNIIIVIITQVIVPDIIQILLVNGFLSILL